MRNDALCPVWLQVRLPYQLKWHLVKPKTWAFPAEVCQEKTNSVQDGLHFGGLGEFKKFHVEQIIRMFEIT